MESGGGGGVRSETKAQVVTMATNRPGFCYSQITLVDITGDRSDTAFSRQKYDQGWRKSRPAGPRPKENRTKAGRDTAEQNHLMFHHVRLLMQSSCQAQ